MPWFQEHGGAVLSTTINKYCYLNCRRLPPFFDYKNRIVWSQIETVNEHSEIVHPVVREVLKMLNLQGVEIHHGSDLPSRAGLGSSSSFTVGLLHALQALKGNMTTKEQLARTAIHVEQVLLRENVGVQDQLAAAYGGFNKIEIGTDGNFKVFPVTVTPSRRSELQASLLMFYTGTSRIASNIAGEQIQSIPAKTHELHQLRSMVDDALRILSGSGSLNDFGHLLHEAWSVKRSLTSSISPGFVDVIYDTARSAGALGGKLLGAGGGGFMLFFVSPERREEVLLALNHLLVVPIQFENSGSQIIFYEPDDYSRTALSGRSFERHFSC